MQDARTARETRTRRAGAPPRAPSVSSAVGRFMAASLAVLVAFAAIVLFIWHRVGTDEAIRAARDEAVLAGRGVIGPNLTPGVFARDPQAIAALDEVVRSRVLDDRIVRIKVWTADGRVLYSDSTELIGRTFPLEADEVAALEQGRVLAGETDLTGADNATEQGLGKLLEVYYPLQAPGGQRVFVESYERFDGVASDAGRLWGTVAPTLIGAILLLWLIQAPMAWGMARRLQRGQVERERLIREAHDATEAERQRIAADLHDGIVQRLAGTAYSLAAARDELPPGAGRSDELIDDAILEVRRSMTELRSLIVEIAPPSLGSEGLEPALNDLVAPLAARSMTTHVDVAPQLDASPTVERLIYRAAQEAVRNVVKHAEATTVSVRVSRDGEMTKLVVDDDGRGPDDAEMDERRRRGHVGLAILETLSGNLGGSVSVGRAPIGGTRLELEVPST